MKQDNVIAVFSHRTGTKKWQRAQNTQLPHERCGQQQWSANAQVRRCVTAMSERRSERCIAAYGTCGALILVLSLAGVGSAEAAGSNSTSALGQPTTPTAVTPSSTQLFLPQGGCAQQYTNDMYGLEAAGHLLDAAGLAAQTVSTLSKPTLDVAAGAGLDEAAAGVVVPGDAGGAAPGLLVAASSLEIKSGSDAADYAGLVTQGLGIADAVAADSLNGYMNTLPNCDQTFAGTVKVNQGGVNVTGASLFQNHVAVAASVTVEGALAASTIKTSQGISADGGKIWLGDTNGKTYSNGITLGGGALSGAGYGGAEAYTGAPTAIAVGNNAQADQAGSLALGFNSVASGVSGTAVGNAAQAYADKTVAIGAGALVMPGAGPGAFAGGTSEVLGGDGAVSIGDSNAARGNGAVAIGDPNVATGTGAVAIGASNTASSQGAVAAGNMDTASGQGAVATGNMDTASGQGAIAIGDQNAATGVAAIAEGQGANATADGSIALGQGATADATNSMAIGRGSNAEAPNSTAIGQGATVSAQDVNSTAIGTGATTSYDNQIVLGSSGQSLTVPGINSALSRSRQVGGLGIVTTDALGNLASDNGTLFKHMATTEAGVAIAFALPNPVVNSSRRHGLMVNVATYYGAYGVGVSAADFLGTDFLKRGDSLALSAAMGWGRATEEGYTESQVGARVGLEYSW